MSESYSLGTAHGVIKIDYDGAGVDAAQQGLKATKKTVDDTSAATRDLSLGMAASATAIVAGFVSAVNAAADFQQGLSNVQAVSGATADEMALIEAKALAIGKASVFSATESVAAMEELVKAGVSVEDVLGGAADATVALAAAGGVALPEAASIAANALNAFGLAAKDLPHVADQLAGAANASAIDVSELGQSLQQSAAVAHLAGLSFDDTTTAIALMGNAGIKGSDAGTSLKTMLQRLQPQTDAQAKAMRELGVVTADGSNKFFTATGAAKSLAGISSVLSDALEGQTQQQKLATLQTVFGTDAIRAAAVVADAGAKGITDLAEAMGKVTAADVAATRMDNFRGSLEQLSGSAETFMITIGTPFLQGLAAVADGFSSVIDLATDAPGPIKVVGTVLGLVAAGALAAAAGYLVLLPRIAATTALLEKQAAAGSLAARSLKGTASFLTGPWGAAIGVATLALGFFAKRQSDADARADELRGTLDQQTGALTDNTRAFIANRLEQDGLLEVAQKAGVSLDDVTAAVMGDKEALDRLAEAQAAASAALVAGTGYGQSAGQEAYDRADAITHLRGAVGDLRSDLDAATESQKRAAEAAKDSTGETGAQTEAVADLTERQRTLVQSFGLTADGARDLSGQLDDAEESAADLGDTFDAVKDAVDALNDVHLDQFEAQISLHDAIAGAEEALDAVKDMQGGLGAALDDTRTHFDLTTEGGRKLQGTLDDLAGKYKTAADAAFDQAVAQGDGKQAEIDYQQALADGRDALAATAERYGLTTEAAQALADQILGTPAVVIEDNTDELNRRMIAAAELVMGFPPGKLVKLEGDPSGLNAAVEDGLAELERLQNRKIYIDAYLNFKQGQTEFTGGGFDGQGRAAGRAAGPTGGGGVTGGAAAADAAAAFSGLSAGQWAAAAPGTAGGGADLGLAAAMGALHIRADVDAPPARHPDNTVAPMFVQMDNREYNTLPREASVDKARAVTRLVTQGLRAAGQPRIVVVPDEGPTYEPPNVRR